MMVMMIMMMMVMVIMMMMMMMMMVVMMMVMLMVMGLRGPRFGAGAANQMLATRAAYPLQTACQRHCRPTRVVYAQRRWPRAW